MKKILFIASESINLKSGGGLANKAFLHSLLRHFPEQVDVIQLAHSEEDKDKPHYFYVPALCKRKQLFQAFRGHFHRLYSWMPKFLKQHGDEYSHCIMNQSFYGDLIPIISSYGIKVAVIHHNYEVRYQMDNKLPATLYGLTPYFVRRNERMALSLSSLNLFLTESDYRTISEVYSCINKNHAIIGMYEPESTPVNKVGAKTLPQNILAICGSLDNRQTESSIHEFFDKYYNIICDIFNQDFQLVITGRNPGQYIQSVTASYKNVKLIPNPPHIEDVLCSAGIFICPVNCGSGLKLRIMDGLRLGMPILTHKISANGYEPFFSYPWFRVYDDITSFRNGLEQIIKVMKNQNIKDEIIGKYYSQFSFCNGDKRFLAALSSFINS